MRNYHEHEFAAGKRQEPPGSGGFVILN